MSRIGKKPIAVPKGVKVDIADRRIKAEGPKGTLEFEHRPEVRVLQDNGSISVDVDESLVGDAAAGVRRALAGVRQRFGGHKVATTSVAVLLAPVDHVQFLAGSLVGCCHLS